MLALLLVLAAAMSLSACGGESPSDVVERVIEAYNQQDFDTVYDASSQTLQQAAGTREAAIEMLQVSFPPGAEIIDLEITGETIDGDRATVTWTGTVKSIDLPEQKVDTEVRLIKENGEWKVDQQSS